MHYKLIGSHSNLEKFRALIKEYFYWEEKPVLDEGGFIIRPSDMKILDGLRWVFKNKRYRFEREESN